MVFSLRAFDQVLGYKLTKHGLFCNENNTFLSFNYLVINYLYYFLRLTYIWDKSGGEKKEDHKSRWKYTALFEDLADDNNQLITRGGNRPNDNVEGYTTRQMQEAVRKSRTLDQLESELWKVNNPTKEHLGELFDFYKRVEDTRKQ